MKFLCTVPAFSFYTPLRHKCLPRGLACPSNVREILLFTPEMPWFLLVTNPLKGMKTVKMELAESTFEGVFNWRCAGLPPPRVPSSHLSVRYLCFTSAAGDVGFDSPVGLISWEEIWTCEYNRNFCFSTCLNLWVSISIKRFVGMYCFIVPA